jgi:uncharacterized protein (TIGR00369 family)
MAEIETPGTDGDTPWREPVRGGYPDPGMIGLPGIEQLRALLDGRVPRPPLSHLTGNRLAEVQPGRTTFEMPLTRWLCSPPGPISIGPLAIAADAAMATAIQTQLPTATPSTTSELSLRLLSTARPGGTLRVRAEVIQVRRTIGLSEARLTDGEGRLLGHGTTLCFVQPRLTEVPLLGDPPPPSPLQPTPDPFERPATGEILEQAVYDRMGGLEILRAQIDRKLPKPPIAQLMGLRPRAADPGAATFSLPASEWLCAPPRGRVQGGCVALLAEAALIGAIQTLLGPGTAVAPIDLKVNYLRPLAADGREALAVGRVLHAGRRIAVASSEVRDAAGKAVGATGSAMLLPGRPASLGIPAG